jgi:hypothetical protein
LIKSGVLAGLIAGVIAGVSGVLFGGLGAMVGLYGTPPISVVLWTIYWMIITPIFGAIFGVLYQMLYDSIPGEGIKKGAAAGLMVWLIKDIATAVYLGAEQAAVSVIAIVWVGFFIWFVYGLVIGLIYEK